MCQYHCGHLRDPGLPVHPWSAGLWLVHCSFLSSGIFSLNLVSKTILVFVPTNSSHRIAVAPDTQQTSRLKPRGDLYQDKGPVNNVINDTMPKLSSLAPIAAQTMGGILSVCFVTSVYYS